MHEQITIPELTEIVARLTALLGKREGAVVQLQGGMNRNFHVNFGGTDLVVRLPGRKTNPLGIDREAERLATKVAAELKIAPRVVTLVEDPPCLVTRFVHGRLPTAEELGRPPLVEQVGASLRAFHESGVELPASFDTLTRVDHYARVATQHGSEPPDAFTKARRRAKAIGKRVGRHAEHTPVPTHNDLVTDNFILDERERVFIIDWEYAGMGDRWFDLANFAVNNKLDDDGEERLLHAYFGEPADERRRATLKVFGYMSDLREAMWGLVQAAISERGSNFAGYAEAHFDRLERTGSDPRFERWVRVAGN